MTITAIMIQSQTSGGVNVKIEVDPNSVLHTSPEIFAELENKFMEKKNEIQQMRNQLKQEQLNLDNERSNMRNNYQTRLSKLEEDYKIKEETQNYNNNLNIDKTRKEQELLRQKEKEINELKKAFMDRENNLNMRENELINR